MKKLTIPIAKHCANIRDSEIIVNMREQFLQDVDMP